MTTTAKVEVSELIGITSAELLAVSHILNAAYSEGVRVQCGWEGPLPQVKQLAHAYRMAAKEAALREAQFDKDEQANNWCTSIFQILDDSHATDTAIREAIDHYIAQRRAKRGY